VTADADRLVTLAYWCYVWNILLETKVIKVYRGIVQLFNQ